MRHYGSGFEVSAHNSKRPSGHLSPKLHGHPAIRQVIRFRIHGHPAIRQVIRFRIHRSSGHPFQVIRSSVLGHPVIQSPSFGHPVIRMCELKFIKNQAQKQGVRSVCKLAEKRVQHLLLSKSRNLLPQAAGEQQNRYFYTLRLKVRRALPPEVFATEFSFVCLQKNEVLYGFEGRVEPSQYGHYHIIIYSKCSIQMFLIHQPLCSTNRLFSNILSIVID